MSQNQRIRKLLKHASPVKKWSLKTQTVGSLMNMTPTSLPRQDPSFFSILYLTGTGCGTPPRPTLEALPRKFMSGYACTRWTSLLCRGRRIPSKSCYSVSPSTRSSMGCISPQLPGPPFAGCKGSNVPNGPGHCPKVMAEVCCYHSVLVVWY